MKSLLFVVALAAALSPSFQQTRGRAQAPTPPPQQSQPKPCDEATKHALYQRYYRNYTGELERQKVAHEAAKEYLCRCADGGEVSAFLRNWLRKWEAHAAARGVHVSPPAASEAGPRCRCDEMRDELFKLTKERMSGHGGEHGEKVYEASKKFLRVCGGEDERFDAFVRNWVEKYDKAVREFEEGRKADEAPAKVTTQEPPR